MQVKIDLSKYEDLLRLFDKDRVEFMAEVQKRLRADDSDITKLKESREEGKKVIEYIHKHKDKFEKAFNAKVHEVAEVIVEALTDYMQAVKLHPKENEIDLLKYLDYENNPLALFTGYTVVRMTNGEQVELKKFTGGIEGFKEFIQNFMYSARYLDHYEVLKAITLNEYDVLEAIKLKNVDKLLTLQPALAYQKEKGLLVGKRKEGTAFFHCGEIDSNVCPLTKKKMVETYEGYFSLDALAYFDKPKITEE